MKRSDISHDFSDRTAWKNALNAPLARRMGSMALVTVAFIVVSCGENSGHIAQAAIQGDLPVGNPTAPVPVDSDPPPAPNPNGPATIARLPRVLLTTDYVAPTGKTWRVAANGNLQGALDAAQRGDVVLLAPGAKYVGNFVLKPKVGTGWVTVQTETTLPAEGTRMTPPAATTLASLISANAAPALATAPNAGFWRIIGVELTMSPGMPIQNYGITVLGDGDQTSLSAVATDVILDRVYIHGQEAAASGTSRCVALNGARMAVIDSYLALCAGVGYDAQAIGGWNGPGPYKIVNNYLEGAGENILFGGSDPGVPNLVPSDIEIRRNFITKPLSWKGGKWTIKNLIELKDAQRVLIEGNVLQNIWGAEQNGWAMYFATHHQSGHAPWTFVGDITFRYNQVDNVGGGIVVAENSGYGGNGVPSARITIVHNVFTNVGMNDGNQLGHAFLVMQGVADLTIEHNLAFAPKATLYVTNPTTVKPRFTWRNNVGGDGQYVYLGDGVAGGPTVITNTCGASAGCALGGNLMVDAQRNPTSIADASGTYWVRTRTLLGLVNPLGLVGDYRLGAASPFRGKGTDGTDPGPDYAKIATLLAGVVTK